MTATTTVTTTEQSEQLTVRGISGSIDQKYISKLRPTPKDAPLPVLQQRVAEDGYLFVKNLIPRKDVLHVREG